MISTVGSALIIFFTPSLSFQFPSGLHEWFLLVSVGVYGFLLQMFLTAGLQADHSSRATSMMYVEILFAVALDWAVWGVWPDRWTVIGGAVVVVSALWVTFQQEETVEAGNDEETPLLHG